MKNSTSQKVVEFDQFLLSIEELFRQRHPERATLELESVAAKDYVSETLSRGLYLSLTSEAALFEGRYHDAISCGSESLKILAPSALNRRVGRVLWNLSKAYSLLGNLEEAELRARDSISAYRRAGYRLGVVDGLNELAKIAYIKSEPLKAAEFLQDALALLGDDPAKESQLQGNLGRVKLMAGRWGDAYYMLSAALEFDLAHNQELSASRNHLSLGNLRLRQRRFSEAAEQYSLAEALINKHSLVRESLILKEYQGELAYEKGDYRKARTILSAALEESQKLAPESGLVTQIGRQLAETLFKLGLVDQALDLAQSALNSSERLGEKVEIGQCNCLIATIFASKTQRESSANEAHSYYESSLQILRKVGDPYELGRALMSAPKIYISADNSTALDCLIEARQTLDPLDVEYFTALAAQAQANLLFDNGRFSDGYQPMCRARELFERMDDQISVRQIDQRLQKVASDAVALSLSEANSFNLFGGFAAESDTPATGAPDLEKSIEALRAKTVSDRAVAVSLGDDGSTIYAYPALTEKEQRHFGDSFAAILGQEISQEAPSLILNSSRDPYINDLLPKGSREVVTSVIVTPLRVSGKIIGYMYLDRLAENDRPADSHNPFVQEDLNFAVGYADFIALEIEQSQKSKLVEENNRLRDQMRQKVGFPNIITENPEMIELLANVRQVADSDISISIAGETGSGKDLLAKAIHYNSVRREKRFISVNCAALPETLLESELFGYKRGAFTGADRDKPGLFEEADGGTFFLDEIGDMSLAVQAKILRVLEEKEVMRLGDSNPRSVDVRIISATHKDLQELIDSGKFRKDLYYRLVALDFYLPPLRERREDIPLLIERFCGNGGYTFIPQVMQFLVSYDWPGNIRELENEIKKLCLVSGENRIIKMEMLSNKISGSDSDSVSLNSSAQISRMDFGSSGTGKTDFSLYEFIANHEKQFIGSALSKSHGVKKHAAALLNIPESTLRLKIKQYDINTSGSAFAG